ncbi:MAG TPA: hypothetical protein V6C58_19510 [Allocoleopsis sp.]
MNKTYTNQTEENEEMLEEYGELLEQSNVSKHIRGKYANGSQSIVKITSDHQVRNVMGKTIETEANVNDQGELMINIPSEFSQGKYRVTLIVEQPINFEYQ